MIRRIISKDNFRNYFFLVLIILTYYRSPYIFNYGRFFSLDLTYHLIISKLSLFDAFLYVDYAPRYINLISNISSIISSRFFDLENAQYVSVYLSLLIYLIIFYKILYKDSHLFNSNTQKCFASLICLLAPMMNFEIWLNAINLQVYLGLLTIIIFFLKEGKKNKFFNFTLLIIAGLSGVYSCALTPLFFFKYFLKKNNYNLICFLILFCSSLIQIFIIYVSTSYTPVGITNTSMALVFTKYEAISYFYNVIVRSFFGSSFPKLILNIFNINLDLVFNNTNIKNILFIFSITIITILIFFISWIIKITHKKEDKIIFLYLIFLIFIFSAIVIIGGVSDSLHGRYSTLPALALIFFILHFSKACQISIIKKILILLIICSISFGFYDFRLKKYIFYLDCINCPDWKEEVKKYKNNKSYKLNAWPYHIER